MGGAVTQAWKTDVQRTERYSWGSLATATVFGGISGFAGGVLGRAASMFIAPVAKTAVAAVANSVRSVTSKAASSASGAARAIGTGAKAVAKRATGTASKADDAAKSVPGIKAGAAGGETAGRVFSQRVGQQALDENASTCVYCRMETYQPQVDHAIPRSRGGDATIENAQTTCAWCNGSKGARDFPVNPPPGYEGAWPPAWWRMRG